MHQSKMFGTVDIYDAYRVIAPDEMGSIEEYIRRKVDPSDDYVNLLCTLKGSQYHVFSMEGGLFYVEVGDDAVKNTSCDGGQ